MDESRISLMSIFIDIFHDRMEIVRNFYNTLVDESVQYAKDTTLHLTIGLLLYIVACVGVYFATVYLKVNRTWGKIKSVKRVLFVTAHPDDECMFFGPTILTLAKQKDCGMYLLCLSNGNFEEKGNERKQELWNSCNLLGIPDSNITLYKSDDMPDDPHLRWREDVVANIILNHIESLSIDTVITFDKVGVSRHQNHISLFYATAYLCLEKKLPLYCRAYALESINVVRKYSWILDVPLSFFLSTYWYILPSNERRILKAAMAAHKSQYVWFRKLYMAFSRYTVMNTLKEIEIIDLELDLELDD
ncbi:N-acetylglucosaminyl-phosphatidylinositol de-N-acetylase [Schistocerca americana]|uniref:N-acetylglucosaminyl-phosphatidylinositol de-N-acetylase n=1 Tax=Schistocerca americana TaxID=7009 RepID=UPI001F4F9376|nr:N-acetylglucosaminyl-phosphatidylinositol de-N-acetylase [Schistocerca americana]XP_047097818.1 N-acetylglucosaminyl-phosphatidylinositol de-N-acetylase [Schistocerca piceifrons]